MALKLRRITNDKITRNKFFNTLIFGFRIKVYFKDLTIEFQLCKAHLVNLA